jgi:hypothetical protein
MSARLLAASIAILSLIVVPTTIHAGQPAQIVVENDRLEPRLFETLTGERVDFVNRTGHPVHLQFVGDIRQHEVIQIPAMGPAWAVFHRPGTHPYVVHIYERQMRALEGVVSVTTDATHQWQSTTCDVVVEGNCLAP